MEGKTMLRKLLLGVGWVAMLTLGSMEALFAAADFDNDRDVDLGDFAAFQRCFGEVPGGDCLAAFDLDDSGGVDALDYALFRRRFAGPDMPPGMVLIPGGAFWMGDHFDEGEPNELPVHAAYVDSFYMDIYEVTNRQYADALNRAWAQGKRITVVNGTVYQAGSGTSYWYCETTSGSPNSRITWDGNSFGVIAGKENHPMLTLYWYGAAAYANWQSELEGRSPCYSLLTWECDFDADGYRLPTEAEWEYAARGGRHYPYFRYPWGNSIDGSMANSVFSGDPYETGTDPCTTPVGYYDGNQTPPGVDMANGYGLYDVAGNVWEWCNDWLGPYSHCDPPPCDNPHGPASGSFRVLRGGAWSSYHPNLLRCATRYYNGPRCRHDYYAFGFRLILNSD